MAFKERQPHELEFTGYTSKGVLHYTCNPPSDDRISALGIEPKGNDFGVENYNAMLLIPESAYNALGYEIRSRSGDVHDKYALTAASENLLRKAGEFKVEELERMVAELSEN